MHTVADLITFARKTKGDVPPPLVGASTTVVGNKMYLFGGRLVSLRRMVSDLYVFDLETFVWEKIESGKDDDVPGPRYFHSADSWENHLIIFGGMGYAEPESEELCVLSDVRFFSLATRRWLPLSPSIAKSHPDFLPRARYAHLSSVTSSRLFIIGGQDLSNTWLDDIHVFDLSTHTWVQRREYPRHCGTYRSVAVSAKTRVRLPQEELKGQPQGFLGPPGRRFQAEGLPQSAIPTQLPPTQSNTLVHLPYSSRPTPEFPNEVFLYSNYNFTDVKRELEVFSPLPTNDFTITERSNSMTGTSLPPGLRFPTGAILGTHLIIAGTYLAHSYQSFAIWALDLVSMTWSRIDPGSTLATGSWCRGCLWVDSAKFVIFGNRDGNLVEDYNRRLLSWDHVAYIDLEAFGIYQPPPLILDIPSQELGLAALEEEVMADFEVVCDDGRKIRCSRKALEDRWPWFREQRKIYLQAAARALEAIPVSTADVPLPDIPSVADDDKRPDPRLTPRAFHLSEPYPITLALLQYIYAQALITRLQHAPAVLSALLLLSSTYQLPHLESLVKHAMHRALSPGTSVGVYEVATLCDCQSLQIRALRVVMSSSKRPGTRSRTDRPEGGRGHDTNHGNGGGGGGGGPHGGPGSGGSSRPRGMSDARPRTAEGREPSSRAPGINGYMFDRSNEAPRDFDTARPRKDEPKMRKPATADGPRGGFGFSAGTSDTFVGRARATTTSDFRYGRPPASSNGVTNDVSRGYSASPASHRGLKKVSSYGDLLSSSATSSATSSAAPSATPSAVSSAAPSPVPPEPKVLSDDASGRMRRLLLELGEVDTRQSHPREVNDWEHSRASRNTPPASTSMQSENDMYFATQPDHSPLTSSPNTGYPSSSRSATGHQALPQAQMDRGLTRTPTNISDTPSFSSAGSGPNNNLARRRAASDFNLRENYNRPPSPGASTSVSRSNSSTSGRVATPTDHPHNMPVPYLQPIEEGIDFSGSSHYPLSRSPYPSLAPTRSQYASTYQSRSQATISSGSHSDRSGEFGPHTITPKVAAVNSFLSPTAPTMTKAEKEAAKARAKAAKEDQKAEKRRREAEKRAGGEVGFKDIFLPSKMKA